MYYILSEILYTMCVRSSVALQPIGATQSLGLQVEFLLRLKWRVALEPSNYGLSRWNISLDNHTYSWNFMGSQQVIVVIMDHHG
jgi:hypothetical protein